MGRIRVIGTSGSGKTHVARELAERLELPHLELDALQHLPGWQAAPLEQFKSEQRAFQSTSNQHGGWVIDGNYNDRAAELFDEADLIVWLDYPRWVVMARVIRRSLGRVLLRRKLWNDNRESLRRLFSANRSQNILLWAWTQHEPNRRRYVAAMSEFTEGRWVRLRTPKETRAWLQRLG